MRYRRTVRRTGLAACQLIHSLKYTPPYQPGPLTSHSPAVREGVASLSETVQ